MSSALDVSVVRPWSVRTFAAFWAEPRPELLSGVRAVLTEDVVGHWPRAIGVVRGADAYYKVIQAVVTAGTHFTLTVGEHATTGDFTFVRWTATVADQGESVQFGGCDRVRTREGKVCENYVFCDHPFFEKVAARLREIG